MLGGFGGMAMGGMGGGVQAVKNYLGDALRNAPENVADAASATVSTVANAIADAGPKAGALAAKGWQGVERVLYGSQEARNRRALLRTDPANAEELGTRARVDAAHILDNPQGRDEDEVAAAREFMETGDAAQYRDRLSVHDHAISTLDALGAMDAELAEAMGWSDTPPSKSSKVEGDESYGSDKEIDVEALIARRRARAEETLKNPNARAEERNAASRYLYGGGEQRDRASMKAQKQVIEERRNTFKRPSKSSKMDANANAGAGVSPGVAMTPKGAISNELASLWLEKMVPQLGGQRVKRLFGLAGRLAGAGVSPRLIAQARDESQAVALKLMEWVRSGFAATTDPTTGEIDIPPSFVREFGRDAAKVVMSMAWLAKKQGVYEGNDAQLHQVLEQLKASSAERESVEHKLLDLLTPLGRQEFDSRSDMRRLIDAMRAATGDPTLKPRRGKGQGNLKPRRVNVNEGVTPEVRAALEKIFGANLKQAFALIYGDTVADETGEQVLSQEDVSGRPTYDPNEGDQGLDEISTQQAMDEAQGVGVEGDYESGLSVAEAPSEVEWRGVGKSHVAYDVGFGASANTDFAKSRKKALNEAVRELREAGRTESGEKVEVKVLGAVDALRERHRNDAPYELNEALIGQMRKTGPDGEVITGHEAKEKNEARARQVMAAAKDGDAEAQALLERWLNAVNRRFKMLRVETFAQKSLPDEMTEAQVEDLREKPRDRQVGPGQYLKSGYDTPEHGRIYIQRHRSKGPDGEMTGKDEAFMTSTRNLISFIWKNGAEEGSTRDPETLEGVVGRYNALMRGLASLLAADPSFGDANGAVKIGVWRGKWNGKEKVIEWLEPVKINTKFEGQKDTLWEVLPDDLSIGKPKGSREPLTIGDYRDEMAERRSEGEKYNASEKAQAERAEARKKGGTLKELPPQTFTASSEALTEAGDNRKKGRSDDPGILPSEAPLGSVYDDDGGNLNTIRAGDTETIHRDARGVQTGLAQADAPLAYGGPASVAEPRTEKIEAEIPRDFRDEPSAWATLREAYRLLDRGVAKALHTFRNAMTNASRARILKALARIVQKSKNKTLVTRARHMLRELASNPAKTAMIPDRPSQAIEPSQTPAQKNKMARWRESAARWLGLGEIILNAEKFAAALKRNYNARVAPRVAYALSALSRAGWQELTDGVWTEAQAAQASAAMEKIFAENYADAISDEMKDAIDNFEGGPVAFLHRLADWRQPRTVVHEKRSATDAEALGLDALRDKPDLFVKLAEKVDDLAPMLYAITKLTDNQMSALFGDDILTAETPTLKSAMAAIRRNARRMLRKVKDGKPVVKNGLDWLAGTRPADEPLYAAKDEKEAASMALHHRRSAFEEKLNEIERNPYEYLQELAAEGMFDKAVQAYREIVAKERGEPQFLNQHRARMARQAREERAQEQAAAREPGALVPDDAQAKEVFAQEQPDVARETRELTNSEKVALENSLIGMGGVAQRVIGKKVAFLISTSADMSPKGRRRGKLFTSADGQHYVVMLSQVLFDVDTFMREEELAHEIAHTFDRTLDLSRFGRGGEIVKLIEALPEDNPLRMLLSFFPLSKSVAEMSDEKFQREVHAKLYARYYAATTTLQKESPEIFAIMEAMYGEERSAWYGRGRAALSSKGSAGGVGKVGIETNSDLGERGENDSGRSVGRLPAETQQRQGNQNESAVRSERSAASSGGQQTGQQNEAGRGDSSLASLISLLKQYLARFAAKNAQWAEIARKSIAQGSEKMIRGALARAEQLFGPLEGQASKLWARSDPNGYEVSSAGDNRFSALTARLKDGRTIEEAYQLDVKGYRRDGNDWRLGKGKPPLDKSKNLYAEYKKLWQQWAKENPKLIEDLRQKSQGKPLTDKFATTDVSQARALAEILNETPAQAAKAQAPLGSRENPRPLPMNYPILNLSRLRPELRGKYSASGSISDLIPNGDRTGTTRNVPLNLKPGDYIVFQNTKTGENIPGVYRVTGFETVDLKTAEGRERWSRNEGWSAEAAASFSNQVRDGATQIRFERVDVEQRQAQRAETAQAEAPNKLTLKSVYNLLESGQRKGEGAVYIEIGKMDIDELEQFIKLADRISRATQPEDALWERLGVDDINDAVLDAIPFFVKRAYDKLRRDKPFLSWEVGELRSPSREDEARLHKYAVEATIGRSYTAAEIREVLESAVRMLASYTNGRPLGGEDAELFDLLTLEMFPSVVDDDNFMDVSTGFEWFDELGDFSAYDKVRLLGLLEQGSQLAEEARKIQEEVEDGREIPTGILSPEEKRAQGNFDFGETTRASRKFSEKSSTSSSKAESVAAALKKLFFNAMRFDKTVQVVQTVKDARAYYPEAFSQAKNPDDVQAFTTEDGKVVMIADNIAANEALGILLHDLGAHIGMKNLLGESNMNGLLKQVDAWAKSGTPSLERTLARKAVIRASKSSSANKNEEKLAYFVEEAVAAGINPTALDSIESSPLRAWFRRFWASAKRALKKIGWGNFDALTAQDVVNIAYGAARLELTGLWHGTAADYRRMDNRHMGEGEGSQYYGWGTYLAERGGIAFTYMMADLERKLGKNVEVTYGGRLIRGFDDFESTILQIARIADVDGVSYEEAKEELLLDTRESLAQMNSSLKAAMKAKDDAEIAMLEEAIDGIKDSIESVKSIDADKIKVSGKSSYSYDGTPLSDLPEGVQGILAGLIGTMNTHGVSIKEAYEGELDILKKRLSYSAEQLRRVLDGKEPLHGVYESATREEKMRYFKADVAKFRQELDALKKFDISKFEITRSGLTRQQGAILRLDVAVEDNEWLQWEEPLSNQSDKVKKIIAKDELLNSLDDGWSDGKSFYHELEKHFHSDKKASEYLDKLGIKGIRMLDGVSNEREVDENSTYNRVVFNDKNITRVMTEVGGNRDKIRFSEKTRASRMETEQEYRETERKYGGRAAYDKAKAAGKTKLNYGQWIQTRTPRFLKWFGDWINKTGKFSEVIDPETGEPAVMYHGTARDIDAFKPKQANAIFVTGDTEFAGDFSLLSEDWMMQHPKQWMTPEQVAKLERLQDELDKIPFTDTTDRYIRLEEEIRNYIRSLYPSNKNIMPLFVSAKKLFHGTSIEQVKEVIDYAVKNKYAPEIIEKLYRYQSDLRHGSNRTGSNWRLIENADVQKAIRALGYDGFVVMESDVVNTAVYSPSQLKSATGNTGEFSADNPSVVHSLAEAQVRARQASQEQVDAAAAALVDTLGDSVQVEFKKYFKDNSSGRWTKRRTRNLIELAMNGDVLGAAHHESLHEFFDMLGKHGAADIQALLKRTATNQMILRQLYTLLKDHPRAIEQLSDPEEALAFMYQFWRAGLLKIGPKTESFFEKVANLARRILGIVTQEMKDFDQSELILRAFAGGAVKESATRAAVIAALQANTKARQEALGRWNKASEFFTRTAGRLIFSAEGLVDATGNKYLIDLMRRVNHKAGEAAGEQQAYFDALSQQRGIWMNRLENILAGHDADALEAAREQLNTRKPTYHPEGRAIAEALRRFLDDMWKYIDERGVRRLNPETNKWERVPFRKDYFAQVWSVEELLKSGEEFVRDLLTRHSAELNAIARAVNGANENSQVTAEEVAQQILASLVNGNGDRSLSENTSNLGMTPLAAAVNRRALDWIDPAVFDKYMEKDLVKIMTRYASGMVKRAEYSRAFGYAGQRIQTASDLAVLLELGGEKLIARARKALPAAIRAWRQAGPDHGEQPTLRAVGQRLYFEEVGEQAGAAKLQEVMKKLEPTFKAIMAFEGTLGHDKVSPLGRSASSMLITMQIFRTMSMGLFSSFNDIMGLPANGGELNDAWRAFSRAIPEIVKTWRGKKSNDWIARRAEEWGTIDASAALDALGQAHGSMYMTGAAKRLSDKFFKWNGMEAWNRAMRTMATQVAERVILGYREEGVNRSDAAAMARFERLFGKGFDPKRIKLAADGRLDTQDAANQRAVMRWVSDAIMLPNAAHRPAWASDWRLAIFWEFKQFAYTLHRVMLKNALAQAKLGNYAPLAFVWLGFPAVMIAGDMVKEKLIPGDDPPWTKAGFGAAIEHGIARGGGFGIPQLGWEALPSKKYWLQPLNLAGPTVGQIASAVEDPLPRTLVGALPGGNLWRRYVD